MKTLLILLLSHLCALAFELPHNSTQAIVGLAPHWNSSHVTLHLYEKKPNGAWRLVSQPWKGRLGKAGLAWGLGLHPLPTAATTKREGDRRAPAGVFTIGDAWGYEANLKRHPALRYTQITANDLWVEDSSSPYYNKHIRLPKAPASDWEKKQQMKQNDAAHALKLFIHHNSSANTSSKSTPHAGSAIFFHIWRGSGTKSTFGCTTMPEQSLRQMIAWLNPKRQPLYILLPQKEYMSLRADWKLP